jgi:hypothetical protein
LETITEPFLNRPELKKEPNLMRFYQTKQCVKKVQRREGDYVKNPFMRAGIENLSAYFAVLCKTNTLFVCKMKHNLRVVCIYTNCAMREKQNTNLILACITAKCENVFINYLLHTISNEMHKINTITKNGGVF